MGLVLFGSKQVPFKWQLLVLLFIKTSMRHYTCVI